MQYFKFNFRKVVQGNTYSKYQQFFKVVTSFPGSHSSYGEYLYYSRKDAETVVGRCWVHDPQVLKYLFEISYEVLCTKGIFFLFINVEYFEYDYFLLEFDELFIHRSMKCLLNFLPLTKYYFYFKIAVFFVFFSLLATSK